MDPFVDKIIEIKDHSEGMTVSNLGQINLLHAYIGCPSWYF